MALIKSINMITNRLYWIDWAKVIGIYLVILGHTEGVLGFNYIYSFHMPFFFIISGFLYKHVSFKDEAKKSIRTLLIPYFCFNAVLICYSLLNGTFNDTIIPNVLLSNQLQIKISGQHNYFAPLWFVTSLFVLRILSSLLTSDKWMYFSALMAMIVSIVCNRLDIFPHNYDLFQVCTSCIAFPFFVAGYAIRKYDLIKASKNHLGKWPYVAAPIVLVMAMAAVPLNGRINMLKCMIGNLGTIYFLLGGQFRLHFYIYVRFV